MSMWAKLSLFLGRIMFGLGLLILPVYIAIGYEITSDFAEFSKNATTHWKAYLVDHKGRSIYREAGTLIPIIDYGRGEPAIQDVVFYKPSADGKLVETSPVVRFKKAEEAESHLYVSLPGQDRINLTQRFKDLWPRHYKNMDIAIWCAVTAIAIGVVLMNASTLLRPGLLPLTLGLLPVPGSIVVFTLVYFRSYLPKREFFEVYSSTDWFERADIDFVYLAPVAVGFGAGLVTFVLVWASKAFVADSTGK